MAIRRITIFCLLLLCGSGLFAESKFAVYGTVGAEKSGFEGDSWTQAGTFGLYYTLRSVGPVSFSVDGRGDISKQLHSALFGPRLAVHVPLIGLTPYGEFLVGAAYYHNQQGLTSTDTSDVAYRFVGGVDYTVLPHIDLRAAEVAYGGGATDFAKTEHQVTLSSGIVVRF